MSLNTALIGELKHESANTRKILERVPTDKLNWLPHERSMKLGRLAKHIAFLPAWCGIILNAAEFDFATGKLDNAPPVSTEDILHFFDEKLAAAVKALESASDEDLDTMWTVRRGEHIMFQLPKKVALRSFTYNHIYHHRGQLSVYLRLLNIPVPGMYGPSADDTM